MKKRWYLVFKVLGAASLALLLLASPCSVRKSLESSLNIEHREVSNKSKACSQTLQESPEANSKALQISANLLYSPVLLSGATKELPRFTFDLDLTSKPSYPGSTAPNVPYYILYGNRKLPIA